MQSQAQVAGQQGQNTQVFVGAAALSLKRGLATSRKPWHSDSDVNVRSEVTSHIVKLVQKHGAEHRLPSIAHELEYALYIDANSKEEYGNLLTLERRICSLMLRIRNSQKATQHGALACSIVPYNLSTPGSFTSITQLPVNNNNYSLPGAGKSISNNCGPRVPGMGGTSDISAQDVGSRAAITNNLAAPSLGLLPSTDSGGFHFENKGNISGTCLPKATSWMIPTPGLNAGSIEASSNHIMTSYVHASNGTNTLTQQECSSRSSGQMFTGTNFQKGSLLSNRSACLASIPMPNGVQVMRPDEMFANNGASLDDASYDPNMKQHLVREPSQNPYHVNQALQQQQQLYGVAGVDPFRLNASGVMEGRRFQSTTVPAGLPQASSFTPIPANYGPASSETYMPLHMDPQTLQMQQFSQVPHMMVDLLPPEQDQYLIDQGYLLQQQQSQHQQQDQQQEKQQQQHPQKEQLLVSSGNILLQKDGEKQFCLQSSESESLQKHDLQVLSMDQHSEQTCQASSADTGQSEVVSNDDSSALNQIKGASVQGRLHNVKRNQWLLIMFWHVSRCTDSTRCNVPQCEAGHVLWRHVITCRMYPCQNRRCFHARWLLKHHSKCRDSKCQLCGPVRSHVSPQAVAARIKLRKGETKQIIITYAGGGSALSEVEPPPVKRVKVEVVAPDSQQALEKCPTLSMSSQEQACCQDSSSSTKYGCHEFDDALLEKCKSTDRMPSSKAESPSESSVSAGSHFQGASYTKSNSDFCCLSKGPETQVGPKIGSAVVSLRVPPISNKPLKKKISGITYLESLTAQQIRQHIASLRKWIGQSKVKAEKNQAMERHMSPAACSACAVETLYFEPIPVFCTQCGCRIKRNATYHSSGSGENALNICGPCYNAIRFDMLETDGFKIQKSALHKKKNDEQRVEAWVECDKCKRWQHQICALFNARINKERSQYVCPDCCIVELEQGDRMPQPTNLVLGARDLPRTILSDFVEERLVHKLQHERAQRAKALGKFPEEVPTADGLVVRVISSVDKKLEVKPRFLEIFQHEEYPKDFLYKSKMLMLFQEIEGVEVCLFGMYVQEFGEESPQPNYRHVYISYLDSVKYFRPDIRTVTGEALRTYVYHEILIAYLDYCKRRGFSSCYIWACPPLKGDDYILYCHPEIQKTPKTDKLRDWYLRMIAKAKKESIVTANKNLYDYFFVSNGDCKAKISAARLPYFEGDYWPGAAEDILQQLQEEEEGFHTTRRGKIKKVATKRTTKTSSQTDITGNVSKDVQLMHKLGQSIMAMKEDFIMVHLHHTCSRCRTFIISGFRRVCQVCGDNFQLCDCCYDEHMKLSEDERHPSGKKECHPLHMEEVKDVPTSTSDRDEIMECEFSDNRQAFLSLCQGNQYQYDTLRRAKHSSMMILYHLHNPNAPAFISSCAICQNELEAGQGWKCRTCSDFDVCNGCYTGQEVQKHPHKFVARTIAADQETANADARKQRMLQLRMMLEVLAHASKCRDATCQFAKCRNMKDLFRHGVSCQKRVVGGCPLCKRQWFLLTAHARSCKESVCSVPRCMDLRKHLRRAQLQQESRRRAAVNEMIRQRAAEAAAAP